MKFVTKTIRDVISLFVIKDEDPKVVLLHFSFDQNAEERLARDFNLGKFVFSENK